MTSPTATATIAASRAPERLRPADPVLTANIYCNRRLNQLMQAAVAPFFRQLEEEFPGAEINLFRYGKCGEHLKVWIFGDDSLRDRARLLLESHTAPFLASADADPRPEDPWISKSGLPPVDEEDESGEDYPNKTLVFSRYRRSPVLHGSGAYLGDDRHVRLFVATQAAGARLTLEKLAPQAGAESFFKHRQSLFLKVLIAGLSGLDFDRAGWMEFLGYHRDWLIRTVARFADPGNTPETILEDFETRAAALAGTIPALSAHVEYGSRGEILDRDPLLLAWRDSVARFFDHVKTYRGRPEYDQDCFTRDFAFLPLFKVFHGVANQFGYRLSHEAYVFHLLLAAARHGLEPGLAARSAA